MLANVWISGQWKITGLEFHSFRTRCRTTSIPVEFPKTFDIVFIARKWKNTWKLNEITIVIKLTRKIIKKYCSPDRVFLPYNNTCNSWRRNLNFDRFGDFCQKNSVNFRSFQMFEIGNMTHESSLLEILLSYVKYGSRHIYMMSASRNKKGSEIAISGLIFEWSFIFYHILKMIRKKIWMWIS